MKVKQLIVCLLVASVKLRSSNSAYIPLYKSLCTGNDGLTNEDYRGKTIKL